MEVNLSEISSNSLQYVAGGSLKELVYEPTKVHLTFPLMLSFAKDIVSGMMHIHV